VVRRPRPLILAILFFLIFLGVELFVAREPVMGLAMFRQKIPVPVGASNFLVSACNFSVIYFFLMWFQVVTLEFIYNPVLPQSIMKIRRSSEIVRTLGPEQQRDARDSYATGRNPAILELR
jgi:hypothetical protein